MHGLLKLHPLRRSVELGLTRTVQQRLKIAMAVKDALRGYQRFAVWRLGNGGYVVRVRLPWYAWLRFGLEHRRVHREVTEAVQDMQVRKVMVV